MSAPRVAIVGAGVAGLAAAWTLTREAPEVEVVVLERAPRAGGLIATERTPNGFLVEHGADCLVTTKPWGVELVRAAGLGGAVVTGAEPRRSFIAVDGKLVPLPPLFAAHGLDVARGLAQTPLLTVRGKLRLCTELFIGRRHGGSDESVGAFVTRRFGRELLEAIVAPLMSGIYGGHADLLSAEACLPRLRELERRHGSIAIGMRRMLRARQQRAAHEQILPPMVSLRDGMESLTGALAHALGHRLTLGVAVGGITRLTGGRFRIATSAGNVDSDGVILAVPAWGAPALVAELDPDLADTLATLPHKALDCVTLAWRARDIPGSLAGTGFVTAPTGARPTIACTWASHKWPGRAPEDSVLVRSVLSNPDASEADLLTLARSDLRDLLGITAPPTLTRVRRLPRATPIYQVGHLGRVAWMRERTHAIGAFALAGNAHGGIGIPDCVQSGQVAARSVHQALLG